METAKYVQYDVWGQGKDIDGILYRDTDGEEGEGLYVKAIGTWADYFNQIEMTTWILAEDCYDIRIMDFKDIDKAFTKKIEDCTL